MYMDTSVLIRNMFVFYSLVVIMGRYILNKDRYVSLVSK